MGRCAQSRNVGCQLSRRTGVCLKADKTSTMHRCSAMGNSRSEESDCLHSPSRCAHRKYHSRKFTTDQRTPSTGGWDCDGWGNHEGRRSAPYSPRDLQSHEGGHMSWSRVVFFQMFGIALLLNVNFTILRNVRNTIAVDQGNGASAIPFFELFGVLPASILMTWGLSWLLSRFQIHKVFFVTIGSFLAFFLLFAFGQLFKLSILFYVLGELWKPALAIILFWGLVNQHIPKSEAKKLYGPLMFANSLGAILAGPLVSFCTSSKLWTHALNSMMIAVTILGAVTALLYYKLWNYFSSHSQNRSSEEKFSLKESAKLCLQVPQLERLLSWIVIADYIAYSLGEVIFFDLLHVKFPNACDYCNYLSILSTWCGVLTVISALLITPYILQRTQWICAALATPLCLLLTEGAFFFFSTHCPLSHLPGHFPGFVAILHLPRGQIHSLRCFQGALFCAAPFLTKNERETRSRWDLCETGKRQWLSHQHELMSPLRRRFS